MWLVVGTVLVHCLALLHLATKLSQLGGDVDGLVYRLHWPADYG
jgi:hypothetical protein